MQMVLYADVLFLIDFSMDFLSLYAAGALLALPRRLGRMLLAAAAGGLYGAAVTAVQAPPWIAAPTAVLMSAAMTRIAFGRADSLRTFLRSALSVWGCGALIAGFLTLFSGLFGGALPGFGGTDIVCAACAAVFGFTRLLRRHAARGYADVRIPYGENVYEGRALIDSGNLLTDPLSGLPVILMRAEDARQIAGDEVDGKFHGVWEADSAVRGGVRAVPVHSGTPRMLYGFFCPEVLVRAGGRNCRRSAVVCVDFEAAAGFGGCGVLLPAALLV